MEPRPPTDSPPTAELPSELEDITKELAALRGGVDAAIWEPRDEAPPPPPPKRIEINLASTEHLVNVLAGLSDARDSFAAAWDAEDEEPEAPPPPPPPRATKPPRPAPQPRRVPTNKAAEQSKAAAAASRARREQAAREVEE